MKLKDIITRTAMIVGLDEIDVTVPSAALKKLADCANNVYSELVLQHVPLKDKKKITFTDGKALYADFPRRVREILKISSGGERKPFAMYSDFVEAEGAEGQCEVEYLYHTSTLGVEEEVILPPQFNEYAMATGVAAEYFYRMGYIDEAEFYKSRYDAAVANASRRLRPLCISPGRRLC